MDGGDRRKDRRGFTLVEMLVVMAVIGILLALVIPALGPLKNSRDVTAAAYDLAGTLETARNYAMANNTYTWVGFYEQDFSKTSTPAPSSSPDPSKAGVGHLTVGIVYSKDGTKLVDDTIVDSTPLPAAKLGQVGKLTQIYTVHLEDLYKVVKPDKANSEDPLYADTLRGRPYPDRGGANGEADSNPAFISSESTDITLRPFMAQGYTFYKTIRFNPRGEANVNSTLPFTKIIELGLTPTHGNVKASNPKNVVVIQQTGIGGAVNIYRP